MGSGADGDLVVGDQVAGRADRGDRDQAAREPVIAGLDRVFVFVVVGIAAGGEVDIAIGGDLRAAADDDLVVGAQVDRRVTNGGGAQAIGFR